MNNHSSVSVTTPFAASIMLKASTDDNDEWIVSGPAVSLQRDYDGEVIEKTGIVDAIKRWITDFKGHIDYEHGYSRSVMSGKPDPDLIIARGVDVTEIDGRPWITARLLKGKDLAEKVWRHLKSGGELGFSIEGVGTFHPQDKTRRVVTEIRRMTIAPIPKGFDQTLRVGRPLPDLAVVAKALVDGVAAVGVDAVGPHVTKAADMPVQGAMLTQDQAHYRPDGSRWACRNCAHWEGGGKCDKVQGTVYADGNCDYFEAPPDTDSGETQAVVLLVDERGVRKALTTGGGIVADQDTGGRALRKQSIEGKRRPPKLGTGERFKKLEHSLAARGARNPAALAAWIGRKKYGKKRFARLGKSEDYVLRWRSDGNGWMAKADHGVYGIASRDNMFGGYYMTYNSRAVERLGAVGSEAAARRLCEMHHERHSGGAGGKL